MRRVSLIIFLAISTCFTLSCARNPEKEEAGQATGAQPGGSASQAGAPTPLPGPQIVEAASTGDAIKVTALIDTGTDVNTRSEFGVTPLMAASAKGHTDVVRVLLAQGADVSLKDKQGLTARTYAMNSSRKEIVEMLDAAGAKE